MQTGPRNLITDVDGISVGNARDMNLRSGTTVVLPDATATAAVENLGGAPATHETDLLDAENLVDNCNAIVLSGGSAWGLEASAGAMAWLAEHERGYEFGGSFVPIVPAAALFDLGNGGDKDWGTDPPYRGLGYAACNSAGKDFTLGNQGAGAGARSGRLKGGLGSTSVVLEDGIQVGAVVAVNAGGSTVIPGTSTFWAWPFEMDDELGGQKGPGGDRIDLSMSFPGAPTFGFNTTLGVVATNATLTPAQAKRIAIMAHDGLARSIRPVHTLFDGDTVFALATGTVPLPDPAPRSLSRIGTAAADAVARAVARGVFEAETLGRYPAYRETHADGFGA